VLWISPSLAQNTHPRRLPYKIYLRACPYGQNQEFLCQNLTKFLQSSYKVPRTQSMKNSQLLATPYEINANLRRNVLEFYNSFCGLFSTTVSARTTCFWLTMVVSGFGPYHCLWHDNAPTEHAGVIPTLWANVLTLGLVSYHWGHELLVIPPPPCI
jgi:hypothetical protein